MVFLFLYVTIEERRIVDCLQAWLTRTRMRSSRLAAVCANALRYCAAKDEKYYGFKVHLVISLEGVITGFTLTPANASERDSLWEITNGITGLLIGDKGYLGKDLQQDLLNWGMRKQSFPVVVRRRSARTRCLQTAKRSNMKDTRDRHWVKLLVKTRRLVETVIGQLTERFHLHKVRARDLWHLTHRLNRKLLAHTLAFWINRDSAYPLQFEQLISN